LDSDLSILTRKRAERPGAFAARLRPTDVGRADVVAAHRDLNFAVDATIPLEQFLTLGKEHRRRTNERDRCQGNRTLNPTLH
jgi:hypothetical protein